MASRQSIAGGETIAYHAVEEVEMLPRDDRPYFRYFSLAHMHNNPDVKEADLRLYRAALSKVINSLSWKNGIVIPEALEMLTRSGSSMHHRHLMFACSLGFLSFYLLEEILLGMWHGKTFSDSIPAVGGGTLGGILSIGIIMFVVLMPFFALKEIGRDIGEDKLYELFFVRRTKYVSLRP